MLWTYVNTVTSEGGGVAIYLWQVHTKELLAWNEYNDGGRVVRDYGNE